MIRAGAGDRYVLEMMKKEGINIEENSLVMLFYLTTVQLEMEF